MKRSDILDWLSNIESQVEADGYQQNENSNDPWYVDGPPQIVEIDGNKMEVRIPSTGERFILSVERKKS